MLLCIRLQWIAIIPIGLGCLGLAFNFAVNISLATQDNSNIFNLGGSLCHLAAPFLGEDWWAGGGWYYWLQEGAIPGCPRVTWWF